ncbi:MAG: plasmid mobilization relaxosome protein MobC [Ruminococcus sp.]|nr:plasmid mobilization relaxosome protein MobC [Ruminococcus sp.]
MSIESEKRENSRKRKIQIKFYVDEDELKFIQAKMNVMHIKNREAYLRKMAIDGQCIRYDYTEFGNEMKLNNHLIGNVSRSINQIAMRVNSTGNIYNEDVQELAKQLDIIWERQRKIMKLFLKEVEEK